MLNFTIETEPSVEELAAVAEMPGDVAQAFFGRGIAQSAFWYPPGGEDQLLEFVAFVEGPEDKD